MSLSLSNKVNVIKVQNAEDRDRAVQVLKSTYDQEKQWIYDADKFFPVEDLERDDISWFVSQVEDLPVGVLRVMYNPPLELYKEYGFQKLESGLDVEEFVKNNRIAEIGRFAVLPEYRRYIVVVAALMRAASQETVERDYSHYVTDIFEGEKHSPYEFHTRVMGFKPVATHDVGELNCPNRRITMVLDIREAYNRIKSKQKWIFRFLTKGWGEELHAKLLDKD
jgi:ribosomal protein S18 acetylase RimI-like enzyme